MSLAALITSGILPPRALRSVAILLILTLSLVMLNLSNTELARVSKLIFYYFYIIMLAGDLITDEIPPLKITDTVELALDWMEQFKVSHLPVVKNRELIGLVAETDQIDYEHPYERLNASKVLFLRPVIHYYQQAYDSLRVVRSMNLTLVPVIDEKEFYKGCITIRGLIQNLGS